MYQKLHWATDEQIVYNSTDWSQFTLTRTRRIAIARQQAWSHEGMFLASPETSGIKINEYMKFIALRFYWFVQKDLRR